MYTTFHCMWKIFLDEEKFTGACIYAFSKHYHLLLFISIKYHEFFFVKSTLTGYKLKSENIKIGLEKILNIKFGEVIDKHIMIFYDDN